MITWELILALAVYNFIMYATPGPNNSILTASGIKFGFTKSIPNIFGIPTGHGLQLALVCLGLGSLFIKYPILFELRNGIGNFLDNTYHDRPISGNNLEFALIPTKFGHF